MKNLVILHLESLSNYLLYIFKDELYSLVEIMNRSQKFNNFFATSTSSIMSVCEFLYGNDSEMDHMTSFDPSTAKVKTHENNFLKLLSKNGYCTYGIGYPIIWRDDPKYFGIWDKERPFQWVDDKDKSYYIIEKHFVENKNRNENAPFAVYIWPLLSHLYYLDEEKNKAKNSLDRIKAGYKDLNYAIESVWNLLKKNNLLQNTIIIGFGDHGDDFLTHSLNGGMCHGFEPYTTLINNPLFIFDSTKKPQVNDKLASLIDLRMTILNLLNIKNNFNGPYTGIDLFSEKNDHVFSQNLFLNQTPNKYLNKSYSVTNKKYHLIVSELGLEMYLYKIDITNHNNLLSFFRFEKDSKIEFIDRNAFHIHFKRLFSIEDINEIKENFYLLRKILKDHITKKKKNISDKLENPFNLKYFNKIRPRRYYWNNPSYPVKSRVISWVKDVSSKIITWLKTLLPRIKNKILKTCYLFLK